MNTSSLTMIQAIEALNWSETKETYTKKGIYRVKSLSPVPSVFWNFWKSAQAILEKQGYAMRKHDGIWYALRFYELARPETMQRLVDTGNVAHVAKEAVYASRSLRGRLASIAEDARGVDHPDLAAFLRRKGDQGTGKRD